MEWLEKLSSPYRRWRFLKAEREWKESREKLQNLLNKEQELKERRARIQQLYNEQKEAIRQKEMGLKPCEYQR